MLNSSIIDFAAQQLQDSTGVTWPTDNLLLYLDYAVKEIVDLKPEAGSVVGMITLVAGTRQTIPDEWNALLSVKRNENGPAITPMPRRVIDETLPTWHIWPARPTVVNVIADDRDPRSFDVFPPQPPGAGRRVEAIGSAYPATVNDAGAAFPLEDKYIVAATDYVIYRALNEATTIPNAQNKANAHLAKFYQALGIKKQAERTAQAQGV